MEEITEEADYYSMFDDGHEFSQTDWSHLLTNKINSCKWKYTECDDIKIKMNMEAALRQQILK